MCRLSEAKKTSTRGGERNRLLQPDLEQRLARHFHLLAVGDDLHARARAATRRRTDGCALAAARDAANDRAEHCAAADLLGSVAAAPFALHVVIAAHERIVVTVD